MGCCDSKEDKHVPSKKNSVTSETPNDIRMDSVSKYDEQIISSLKRDLKENPQWFVLNNILMNMQFFENYQRDILKLSHSATTKMEKDLNKTLPKDEMECTCPDIIFDKVNKNIKFRPLHGPKKHSSEPLASQRLFVINLSIEVVNSMDIPQYTSIDKPAYQVRIEESKRKGFVRLKQTDTNKFPKKADIPLSEPVPSTSSKSSDSEYDYSTITDIKTPKPLDVIHQPYRRNTLPETCFALRKVKRLPGDVDSDEYDVEITEEELFETVTYVDAKGFMNYFTNALFPNYLGRALGFDQVEIMQAQAIPGKIFCNFSDDDDNLIPIEVIPSVGIEWPAEQTFEFIMREERATILDRRTGFRFRWPTDEMIKDIKSMNCVVIPKGFWKKRGNYSDSNIEWEISFPKAERFIESRMSHAQMKCFLFLLAIHKTYIEPVTLQHGLLAEHIRCHMYWECEANYRDWPEHRLGNKLKMVLMNLSQKLSKSELNDYFIKRKNLFENIPRKYLLFAQKVFHDILEAPVMHFITALRNIRYTSGKFYQPLDFTELYRILTQVQGLKLINPNMHNTIPPNLLKPRQFNDAEHQWRHVQQLKLKEKFLKRKMQEEQRQREELERLENDRRVSADSIDLEWTCEKEFDVYKSKALLQLFINNFIDMARDSFRISTKDQALFYLKQAWYLTKILESTSPAYIVEAMDYKEIIMKEEEAVKKNAVKEFSDLPPSTPVRNSAQFDFTLIQQLKNNMVNLNNLHNSYNDAGNATSPTSKKLRHSPSKTSRTSLMKVNAPSEKYKRNGKMEKLKLSEPGKPRKSVSFIVED